MSSAESRCLSLVAVSDVEVDDRSSRSEEDGVLIFELSTVDVHQQTQLDVLRLLHFLHESHQRLEPARLVQAEVLSVDVRGLPSERVDGADELQLELEASVVRLRPAHREEVGRNADVAGERYEVEGDGEWSVQTVGVALRTCEGLALTADGTERQEKGCYKCRKREK